MAFSDQSNNVNLPSNIIQSEITNELAKIATKIALQNFDWSFITLVLFNSTISFGVQVFLQSYEKSVIVGKGTFYPKFVRKTNQYVLFGNNVSSIMHILEWMQAHEFDNTGKYIIVCLSLDIQECDETVAIQTLWEYKITNVIFLNSVEHEVTGFTYFPLNNKSCIYDAPVRLKNLTTCLNAIDFKETCSLFPMKLADLHGCPLIVSTYQQLPYMHISNGKPSGSDGKLLLLLAYKLNGNLSVMTPRHGNGWGKYENDDTWSGSLADVYYDYANFSMTSADLTLSRFSSFQLSTAYNTASLVWISHPANKVLSSLKLTYPFQRDAQIALIISFAIVVICSLIIHSRFWSRVSRKIKLQRPHSSITFYSWMICMGLPITRLPEKSAFLYIVLFWIWYCFLVRTLYQVSLITAIKANYYYQEFETIEDVMDAQYSFGGGAALRDHYIDYPSIYNQWKDVNTEDIIPTLRNVSKGMKFAIVMDVEAAKNIVWREKIVVHILPQKVVISPTVVFFKKFSPLANAVNYVLVRLVESGFSDKCYKDYTSKIILDKSGDSIESIRLEHFTGCYVVLITGWGISFVLFVAEVVLGRFYKSNNLLM